MDFLKRRNNSAERRVETPINDSLSEAAKEKKKEEDFFLIIL